MAEDKLMFSKCMKLVISVILIFDQVTNSSGSEIPPVCGKSPSNATSDLVGGEKPLHEFPWHVGIYNKEHSYLCGGTIISPKLILTAAHCITDYEGNVKPSEDYLVAAGKYYSNYTDERDHYAQYSKVSEIHVPERYAGLRNFLSYDIAILVLGEPFEFSIAVQPICLELNEESENLIILLNNTGTVTGWGLITPSGPVAEELKQLIIPYVPFDKCYTEVPEAFRRYITFDKMCGGYINKGTGICSGDGGGGFIFKNMIEDRYYIKGIVSTGQVTPDGTCDINQYALYTSVSHHIDFVKSFMAL